MANHSVYRRDAEASGRYVVGYINPRKRCDRGASVDVIYQLARWAFHWAAVALMQEAR